MKAIRTLLVTLVLSGVITWLLGAYMSNQINPLLWSDAAKFIHVVVVFCITGGVMLSKYLDGTD